MTETNLQCSQAAKQSDPNAKKPSRLLRSCFRVDQQLSRSTHILPNICIICRKQKHIKDRCSGKWSYEHLVQSELIDSGQLLEAAWLKEDLAISCQIENRDCVAIELKYHEGCHREYKRFLSRAECSGEKPEKLYLSFDKLTSHKHMAEALHILRWKAFLESLSEKDAERYGEKVKCLNELFPSQQYAEF